MNSHVKVWFYDPKTGNDSTFNNMVAYFDGPYSHCEVQFPDGQAYTIYMGCTASAKKRSFDTKFYTCITLPLVLQDMRRAQKKANDIVAAQTPFSLYAMTFSVMHSAVHTAFPSALSPDPNTTFCSKLCADVLQEACVFKDINTSNITPSALHRLLAQKTRDVKPLTSQIAIDFRRR